jgi:hypothetical protein
MKDQKITKPRRPALGGYSTARGIGNTERAIARLANDSPRRTVSMPVLTLPPLLPDDQHGGGGRR